MRRGWLKPVGRGQIDNTTYVPFKFFISNIYQVDNGLRRILRGRLAIGYFNTDNIKLKY